MVSLNWIMRLPPGLSAERFDEWYLHTHTKYGKASQGIVRYTVNRALSRQPAAATGDVYRVAQEYWQDFASMVACWNSPSGHAVLGDGLVNIGLDPGTIPAIAITEDRQFEVARPAAFSTVKRGYRSRKDGTITKFLAYGMARNRDRIAGWYGDRHGDLGQDPRIREHVFGTTLGRTIEIGYASSLPGPKQKSYDWLLELWFDSNDDAVDYLDSSPFRSLWAALGAESTERLSALFRGQEMLVSVAPIDHSDS